MFDWSFLSSVLKVTNGKAAILDWFMTLEPDLLNMSLIPCYLRITLLVIFDVTVSFHGNNTSMKYSKSV